MRMVFVSQWQAATDILLLKFVQYLGEADPYVHIYGVWSKNIYIYTRSCNLHSFVCSIVSSFIHSFIYLYIYVSTKSFFCHPFHLIIIISLFHSSDGIWKIEDFHDISLSPIHGCMHKLSHYVTMCWWMGHLLGCYSQKQPNKQPTG